MDAGIEVEAAYEASKSSGEIGEYVVGFLIDPKTRGILGKPIIWLHNRSGGSWPARQGRRRMAHIVETRELRDLFLKTKAWTELLQRAPDEAYRIEFDWLTA